MAQALLDWFAVHQRDLPWRRTRDPYAIWVSEVMLQQTRVETVVPYYHRWMAQFPTLKHLAEAPEAAVLKAWEGLGYYSRARNLQAAARQVMERHGGIIPADRTALSALKGVGPYTAGAILSIAFNQPVPAVDGNVMRVLARLFLIRDDITRPATRQAIEALAAALIPPGQAGAFNQALMELGALICVPVAPRCDRCPVATFCRGRAEGVQESLPIKAKARPPRPVDVVAGVIFHQDRLLLVRRPADGLLGGLWEFPGGERPASLTWEQGLHRLIQDRFGMELEVEAEICRVRHVFTHLIWDLRAFTATVAPGSPVPAEGPDIRWVQPEELDGYPLPVAHQKVAARVGACSRGGSRGRMTVNDGYEEVSAVASYDGRRANHRLRPGRYDL
jgi:A/G-specific adenine glycosylase